MRLLVGLGNPGEEYGKTRHNIGFSCIDAVAALLKATQWKEFKDGQLALVTIGSERVGLFKPMQYMNNSGMQVRQVVDYYNLASEDIAVAYDDVYVQPGSARFRQGGGDGGHNGIKSLHGHLAEESFWRIRIGVGVYDQDPETRHHQPSLEDYVLKRLPATDAKKAAQLIDKIAPNLVQWLEHGTSLVEETVHL